ncbi:right-handed parallel beta-helix repeat-containing protein [Pseudarthrobacter sp. 1C304]|uniref:right-handed parallel beta-helix repeat-containing protein n=1 Tax=Pseudarthrobacter sp. 1C304 TaxID=3457438 RepID=UPI003FD087FA
MFHQRAHLWGAAVTATLLFSPLAPLTVAVAAGATYYVNSAAASCDDSGSGSSLETPWCSLTAASRSYSPGDRLLLARGSTYSGEFLTVSGQGTEQARITVDAYGEGDLPVLDGEAEAGRALVLLENPSYVTVSNLELSYAGAGVLAQYRDDFPGKSTGNKSLEFTDLYVHHISGIGSARVNGGVQDFFCESNDLDLWQSGGAAVTGDFDVNVPTDSYFVSGVLFDRITGHDNLNVVNVDTCDGRVGSPNAPEPAAPHLVRDVTVNNVHAYDGNGAGYAELCNEGMRFDGITGLTVMNSRFENLGACHVSGGTAGFILVAVDDVTFKNNIISDVPNTGSYDMTGIDNELYVNNVTLRNNLIARNAGPGVEFLSLRSGINDYNTNHHIEGNSFYDNGKGSLFRLNPAQAPFSGRIVNNLTADSVFVQPGADFVGLVPSDARNLHALEGTVPFYAADQFDGTANKDGWSYQVGDDASTVNDWASASFTPGARQHGTWGDGAARSMSAFEQTPGTARVWRAPADGDVAIRSLAFKTRAGGGNVTATVLHNGVPVKSEAISGTNTEGITLDRDLAVAEGDRLAFVVTGQPAASDWTSWAPSVMYVATPGVSTGEVRNASFETPFTSGAEFAPRDNAWEYSPFAPGVGAGIVGNGSVYHNVAAPEGRQAAFLQGLGSMSQRISGLDPALAYEVSFDLASRGAQQQQIEVLWDGTVVGEITPPSASYTRHTIQIPRVSDGENKLTLRGTATSDSTAFVDRIDLRFAVTKAPNQFTQNGFESPTVTGIGYSVTGSDWSFPPSLNGNGDGIAANGSAFGQANAPQGVQSAFVQRGGTFSQSVTGFEPGQLYAVRFQAAQRGAEKQGIAILINGAEVSTVTPTGPAWAEYTSGMFEATETEHLITFQGTSPDDRTAFVDVPEIIRLTKAPDGSTVPEVPRGVTATAGDGQAHLS